MVHGSLYVVGLHHIEESRKATVALVLSLDVSLQDALNDVRTYWESYECGYDVEFAVSMETFKNDSYYSSWPNPCTGFAE